MPFFIRLPLCAASLALVTAAPTDAADPARAPPPACVVSAGARSFDLAELGGGGGAGGAPPLRHISHAPDSLGWTYSFAACGDVAPLPAACAGAAPGSAALQQTDDKCYGLGASATRNVTATATGVALSFSGGDGGRSSVVTVECANVMRPSVSHVKESTPLSYTAHVRSRSGCPLECRRNAKTGAVCSGAENGACSVGEADGRARCLCAQGIGGTACEVNSTSNAVGEPEPAVRTQLRDVALLVVALILCYGTQVFRKKRLWRWSALLALGSGIFLINDIENMRKPRGQAALLAVKALQPCTMHPAGAWDAAAEFWTSSNTTCQFFSLTALRECLSSSKIFFLGDSVSKQIASAAAMLLSGCDQYNAAHCNLVVGWPLKDPDETHSQLPASDLSECFDRVLCSNVLHFNSSDISMRFLRYETIGGYTYKGARPFYQQLFYDPMAMNTSIILNFAHHNIHHYSTTEGYLDEVSRFIDELIDSPRWKSADARRSGSLIWRTLTPTEFPPAHRIAGLRDPVDFYKALDAQVANLWTSAGFPVINVSGMVFDARGNSRRFLTHDSVHFTRQALDAISRTVLSQLCSIQRGSHLHVAA